MFGLDPLVGRDRRCAGDTASCCAGTTVDGHGSTGRVLHGRKLTAAGFGWTAVGRGASLQGLARGAMMTVAILLLMETPRVPEERLGLAGGLFFTFAEIGGVMGPVTFGVLSDLSGSFVQPLAALSVVCAVLLAILARLRGHLRRIENRAFEFWLRIFGQYLIVLPAQSA